MVLTCTAATLTVCTLLLSVTGLALARQSQPDELEVGQKAPDFQIPSTVGVPAGGSTVSIKAIIDQGKAVVLAFFPKAFTGG